MLKKKNLRFLATAFLWPGLAFLAGWQAMASNWWSMALALIGAIVAIILKERWRRDVTWPNKPRPIVRVWTHNEVTGVCAEADYQHRWDFLEREMTAYPDRSELAEAKGVLRSSNTGRTIVPLTAFFTDCAARGESIGNFWTGNMSDCKALLHGCRVERTELLIPLGFGPIGARETGFVPLTLAAAYRLIHGPDAVPPAKIEAPEPPAQTAQANA
jgi:hypothetical protein